MQKFQHIASQISAFSWTRFLQQRSPSWNPKIGRVFFSTTFGSSGSESDDEESEGKAMGGGDGLNWDTIPSWSSGKTKDYFDGRQSSAPSKNPWPETEKEEFGGYTESEAAENLKRWNEYQDSKYEVQMREAGLLRQVMTPGIRDRYFKDSEKEEMYRLHKENPDEWTVEKLSAKFRVTRKICLANLFLKEDEKNPETKKYEVGDAIEKLYDAVDPTNYDCEEFIVSNLPKKPKFQAMPEDWAGCERDPDEVHYEISRREEQLQYREFRKRFEFNKKKLAKEIQMHKRSRMRPKDGFRFTVEILGMKGKRGLSGGWRYVHMPDGSTRPLNDLEKMFVKLQNRRRHHRLDTPNCELKPRVPAYLKPVRQFPGFALRSKKE